MKLSYRDAQRLLVGLRKIDEADETKLDGEVRLKIGININRLQPHIKVFEREVQRIQRELHNGKGPDPSKMTEAEEELQRLSDTEDDYKLKKIDTGDLKLSSNTKIKADTLAQIAPVLRKFDDTLSDED